MLRKMKFTLATALFAITQNLSAQTVLTYSDHEPLGNMRTKFINDRFFTAIEKESKGEIKIAPHWNAELSTGYDALKNVNNGTIDMAIVVPEYDEKNLPKHQLFKSFPVGFSGERQVQFLRDVYQQIPEFDTELAQQNAVRLFISTGYPVGFFTPHKLDSLDDIRGKWRTASFWHRDHLIHAGAEPVRIPWGEKVTQALADGSLDGLMVNIDSARDIQAHKTAPNALVSDKLWLGHVYLVVINRDRWEKLSNSERHSIIKAAESVYPLLGETMERYYTDMLNTMKQEGVKLRELTADEVTDWAKRSRYGEVQQNWVVKKEQDGVQGLSETLQKLTNIWQKYQSN